MIGIVIVSHSQKLAEGVKELTNEMARDVPVATAGGFRGGFGTDPEGIEEAIHRVYSPDGVLILYDLGSARLHAEIALETLDETHRMAVMITGAALVEGAVIAAVGSQIGQSMTEILATLEKLDVGKIDH